MIFLFSPYSPCCDLMLLKVFKKKKKVEQPQTQGGHQSSSSIVRELNLARSSGGMAGRSSLEL